MTEGDLPRPGRARAAGHRPARNRFWNRMDDLARIARRGDRAARNRLWERTGPQLHRVAVGLGVPPDGVPDLVQEVLAIADRRLDRFDPGRGTLRTWLVAILVHHRNNLFRRRHRRRRLQLRIREEWNRPVQDPRCGRLLPFEARIDVNGLLGCLSRRQRAVLILFVLKGLNSRETGLILGLTPSGVRSAARQARLRLREATGQPG